MKYQITQDQIKKGKSAVTKYLNKGTLTDEQLKDGIRYLRLLYRMITLLNSHYYLVSADIGRLLERFIEISEGRLLDLENLF